MAPPVSSQRPLRARCGLWVPPFGGHPLALVFDQLDVEAERLEFLDEHVEALRQAGLEPVPSLPDRFVDPRPALYVVGLHGQEFLEAERGAVRLERPDLHLAEPLAAELPRSAERLLGHEAVGPDAAPVVL